MGSWRHGNHISIHCMLTLCTTAITLYLNLMICRRKKKETHNIEEHADSAQPWDTTVHWHFAMWNDWVGTMEEDTCEVGGGGGQRQYYSCRCRHHTTAWCLVYWYYGGADDNNILLETRTTIAWRTAWAQAMCGGYRWPATIDAWSVRTPNSQPSLDHAISIVQYSR